MLLPVQWYNSTQECSTQTLCCTPAKLNFIEFFNIYPILNHNCILFPPTVYTSTTSYTKSAFITSCSIVWISSEKIDPYHPTHHEGWKSWALPFWMINLRGLINRALHLDSTGTIVPRTWIGSLEACCNLNTLLSSSKKKQSPTSLHFQIYFVNRMGFNGIGLISHHRSPSAELASAPLPNTSKSFTCPFSHFLIEKKNTVNGDNICEGSRHGVVHLGSCSVSLLINMEHDSNENEKEREFHQTTEMSKEWKMTLTIHIKQSRPSYIIQYMCINIHTNWLSLKP